MSKGDLVRLKDGGKFTMLISAIDGDKAECVWRHGERWLSGMFSLDSLEPADSVQFVPGLSQRTLE